MKLIQITDLHIGAENEKPFDIDVRANFIRLLEALSEEKFEHLVVSGDLCYNKPDVSIYYWVKKQLDRLTSSYSIISGNHDDNYMINKIFYQQHADQLFFSKIIGDKKIFFLDSSPGEVSQEQLQWLENNINPLNPYEIIFIHHPPTLCEVPHMDNKHYLNNYSRLQQLLHNYNTQMHIFCGHYHLEKTVSVKNMQIYITPSNFFQIDDRKEMFAISSKRIGYRRINFDETSMYTAVKYVDE
ncbi:MAG: hypothetical protein GVY19_06510 [Bacteroidetes bacterium]|nr:hypothetical protein [Bacteroidota bacterium]